jgi:hypothetical protein
VREDDLQREYLRAVELYEKGKPGKALKLLNKLELQRPDSKRVLYSRAVCLALLGRVDEARHLRDRLAGYSGSTAQKLTDQLDATIRQEESFKRYPPPSSHSGPTDEPGRGRVSRRYWILLGGLIAIGAAAVVVLFEVDRGGRGFIFTGTSFQGPAFSAAGPDEYLEVTTLFPAGSEKALTLAIFLAPEKGKSTRADTKIEDCVGDLVASNWAGIKADVDKALIMTSSPSEMIHGVPRSALVITAVLPQDKTLLTGAFQGKQIETFLVGSETNLDEIIAACGQPEYTEGWYGPARQIGLSGQTFWWGRVGIAVNAADTITHLLIRTYPK